MAALGEPLKKRIQAQATCSACKEFYEDPVLLHCGTSVCRACVERFLPFVCPDCGAASDPGRLMPNPNLARLVELAQKLLEQEERREAEARWVAGGGGGGGEAPHEEAVFCKQDQAIIYQSGSVREDHRGHEVIPVDLAAKQYKSHLQRCLVHAKREEKDLLITKTTLEVDYERSVMQVTEAWGKTKTAFQQMEEFLERQKRELLVQVIQMYKEIKTNKKEQLFKLSETLSDVGVLVSDIKDARRMSEDNLLKSIGEILELTEEREPTHCEGSLHSDLRTKISSLVDLNMFLLSSMKHFREEVISELNRHKGITAPNPNGSDPSVIPGEPQEHA